MILRQTAEVGDDGHEDAFHALLVERARQMVMIGQIGFALGTLDDRHHVSREKLGEAPGNLGFPRRALLTDLVHAKRHLGGTQAQDRRRVKNRLGQGRRH